MAKNRAEKLEDAAPVVQAPPQVPVTQSAPSAPQQALAGDVLIPRLLLMQGISPLVTARKAQLGELIRSTTVEKVGDPEHAVDIIPLKITNTWTNYEVIGQKPEFRGSEPRVAANEAWPWEYQKDGSTWKRQKTITLFALLPGDVAAYETEMKRAIEKGEIPDITKTTMPVVITLQSTSFKWAGKKIATHFNTVQLAARRMTNLRPYDYILPLQSREEKGKKGTYFVYDLGIAKALRDADIRNTAASWADALGTSDNVKVDDSLAESYEEGHTETSTDV